MSPQFLGCHQFPKLLIIYAATICRYSNRTRSFSVVSLDIMDLAVSMPGSFLQQTETRSSFRKLPSDRTNAAVTSSYREYPSQTSRKRPRLEVDRESHSSAYEAGLECSEHELLSLGSPSPMVNTNYFLKDGLDTPGGWEAQQDDLFHMADTERDYRLNRFTKQSDIPQTPTQSSNHNPLGLQPSSQTISGWHLRKTAWAVTGGLAGKIFNFCWNTTFRGFSAGGGVAYHLDTATLRTIAYATKGNPSGAKDVFSSEYEKEEAPGAFPEQSGSASCTSRPRLRQGSSYTPTQKQPRPGLGDSTRSNSWVLVEHEQDDEGMKSPARKRSRASIAGGSRKQASRPLMSVHRASGGASYASSRSRTSSYSGTQTRANQAQLAMSPTKSLLSEDNQHRPSHSSVASSHRRQSSLAAEHQSPASPEIESYQRQKRREDKKQNADFRRLNAQLQDMIRQGKEALGSKVEIVNDAETDEGFYDDDGY